jgi:hypothetical protein
MGVRLGGDGRRASARPHAASGGAAGLADAPAATRARALTMSDAAWIAAIPLVALGLLAVVLLGPPLGRALLTP